MCVYVSHKNAERQKQANSYSAAAGTTNLGIGIGPGARPGAGADPRHEGSSAIALAARDTGTTDASREDGSERVAVRNGLGIGIGNAIGIWWCACE